MRRTGSTCPTSACLHRPCRSGKKGENELGKPDQPRGTDGRWIPRVGGALVAAIALALGLASGTGLTSASGAGGGTSGTYRSQDTTKSQKARDRNPGQLLSRLARPGPRHS